MKVLSRIGWGKYVLTLLIIAASVFAISYSNWREARAQLGEPWYANDGTQVSTSVIGAYKGSAHCDWQDITFLHIGWPPGTYASTSADARIYVRDPKRVLPEDSLVGALDTNASLPEDAAFSGYRTNRVELWTSPTDDHLVVYLRFGDHVEMWPHAIRHHGCA